MSSQTRTNQRRSRLLKGVAVASTAALVLTGCSEEVQRGWLPGSREVTNHNPYLTDLWVNSWIAAVIIGLLVWGLMIWVIIAYRRRKNDVGYPKQLAYNVPLEILYTIVPLVMVFVLFAFTDQVQRDVETPPAEESPLVVNVVGKQWAWDFNYEYKGMEKSDPSVQAHLDGTDGKRDTLPTLYLPVDVPVKLELTSRDVIHSFWVPAFLQKRDMIPGKPNYLYLTPGEIGDFDGKCAELCGEYHSEMLFNVKIVEESEFLDHLNTLEDGLLDDKYNRNPNQNPVGEGK